MAGFTYKSYNFVDKDPIIDEIRTIFNASGVNYKWIQENANVSPSTLTAWFMGSTKRPQSATVEAVLRALGYQRAIVPYGDKVVFAIPLPQPKPRTRPSSVRHVVQMHKYRRTKRG